MNLRRKVEQVLEDDLDSRNSDITLMIELWKRFYSEKVVDGSIRLDSLYDLPREDNIKRYRAKLNAEGKYWPTDPKVREARGINEDRWREYMGYPPLRETVNRTRSRSYTEVDNYQKQKKLEL